MEVLCVIACSKPLYSFARFQPNTMDKTWRLTLIAPGQGNAFGPLARGLHDPRVGKTLLTQHSAKDFIVYDHVSHSFSRKNTNSSAGSMEIQSMVTISGGEVMWALQDESSDGMLLVSMDSDGIQSQQLVVAAGEQPVDPCLIKSSNGDIYLFFHSTSVTGKFRIPSVQEHSCPSLPRAYRDSSDYRPLKFVKSTDNGRSWTRKPITAIRSCHMDATNRPSLVFAGCPSHQVARGGQLETFSFAWTCAGYHDNSTSSNRASKWIYKHVYFASFYPATLEFTSSAGRSLGRTIDPYDMDSCLVLDSGPLTMDTKFAISALGADQRDPVVIFNFNSTLMSAVWQSDRWRKSIIERAVPSTDFVVDLDTSASNKGLRLLQARGGVWIYQTDNDGHSWHLAQKAKKPPNDNIKQLVKIRGGKNSLKYIATGTHYWGLGSTELLLSPRLDFTLVASDRSLGAERGTAGGVFNSESNKTFVAYPGPNMIPHVLEYDHMHDTAVTNAIAGAAVQPDFHNCRAYNCCFPVSILTLCLPSDPKILITKTGHLLVVWTDQNVGIYIAISLVPHSSSKGWKVKVIPENPRYPCPIKSTNGDLFIFFRTRVSSGKYQARAIACYRSPPQVT